MGAPHVEKKCGDCGEIKPVENFYRSKRRRDGYCKTCRRRRDRERAARKAARPYDPKARRDYKLRRMYGISLSNYDEMAERQGHACAICRSPEIRRVYSEEPRLVVDHNHMTGKVRGLLCCSCNTALSAIENEQFMLLAKQYLRERDGYEFVDA